MSKVSGTIRLRPTRVALLVRPNDTRSIRHFMRVCSCMWGGIYNPIIPIFRVTPKEWRSELQEQLTGSETSRGYVQFFEPDVFVEAEPHLLDGIGLGALREHHRIERCVLPLQELLKCRDHRDWTELKLGLGITDVLDDIYNSERRFELRDKRPAYLVKSVSKSAFVEAMFGTYPDDEGSSYFSTSYQNVFRPTVLEANPEAWHSIFKHGAMTPLRLTQHKLENDRSWQHDLVFFVFDPSKNTDLIDLWNLRLEPEPICPIPVNWWPDVADGVHQAILSEFRPLQGNPDGVMHYTTIEFSRSIDEARRNELLGTLKQSLPKGSWCYKIHRNRIWNLGDEEYVAPRQPLRVTAREKHVALSVRHNDEMIADFDTLAPDFASLYGGHNARWVNVVNISTYGRANIATVLPFNVMDRNWPRLDFLGDPVVVGTEGWSFLQRYKEHSETLQFLNQEEAVVGSLERLDVSASLSKPGHIAKQVFAHLEGFWGIHLLQDEDTLRLLNDMAMSKVELGIGDNKSEQFFEGRSRPVEEWSKLIAKRRQKRLLPDIEIKHFTDRNIIRLGITTTCPHCTESNWHSLSDADYTISCDRCLETYPFPQGDLKRHNKNWSYRTIGPFSSPNYAEGSYGALLAVNVLENIGHSDWKMTFAPALSLQVDDGYPVESDFVAWVSRYHMGKRLPPDLVVGEAKSLGKGDLIKDYDLSQLRRVAKKLPGAAIVISVMRGEFTATEKRRLLPFVKWTRRINKGWKPTNPVVLLTGVELFHKYSVYGTWENKGGRYKEFAEYRTFSSLTNFAEATQSIHLDLPSFSDDRQNERVRRSKRK